VSRLSKQCEILDFSQPHGHPRLDTRVALFTLISISHIPVFFLTVAMFTSCFQIKVKRLKNVSKVTTIFLNVTTNSEIYRFVILLLGCVDVAMVLFPQRENIDWETGNSWQKNSWT
jgi:hypothetical protein